MNDANKIDLAAIRERLEGKSGPTYWRGLEEIAETDEFRQWLDDEFPNRSTLLQIDRRSFLKEARAILAAPANAGTAHVRILTETVTSPTLADQITRFLAANPGARWHQYEPTAPENTRAGARMAFGADANTIYHFEKASVI